MKNAFSKIKPYYPETVFFFIVFYLVGAAGILMPFSFPLFSRLIPLALFLSVFGLYLFHSEFNKKTILVYTAIYITGFVFEWIGVYTGAVFGLYYYGESLGFKYMETPVIIGLNWLLLVYLTSSVFEKSKFPVWLKIVSAALFMVVYDVIIEQVAPILDMWHWVYNEVPVKNYVAWFLLSVFFHALIKIFNVKTENKLSPVILICQTLFFLVLFVVLKLLR